MTARVYSLALAALLLTPCAASSQTTLTGAMWFATTSSGGTSVSQAYADGANNTLGGDQWWNLWLALNPDATSPVNGPSDLESSISIPLEAGHIYRYYLFGQGPCCTLPYSALNLFFDGNTNMPGISVRPVRKFELHTELELQHVYTGGRHRPGFRHRLLHGRRPDGSAHRV